MYSYVYQAMKAMLLAVAQYNEAFPTKSITSVACTGKVFSPNSTGLGTFYGEVHPDEAARQMSIAYKVP